MKTEEERLVGRKLLVNIVPVSTVDVERVAVKVVYRAVHHQTYENKG